MTILFFNLLLVCFFDRLNDKISFTNKICFFISIREWKLLKLARIIYNLFDCRFCFLFWVGWFSYLSMLFIYDLNFDVLLPFLTSGFYWMINDYITNKYV